MCTKCGVRTRDLQYVTHFHNVTATSLGVEQRRQPGRRLGQLLQSVGLICISCDPDHGIAACSFDLCFDIVARHPCSNLHTRIASPLVTSSVGLWCDDPSLRCQGLSTQLTVRAYCAGGCGAENMLRRKLLAAPPKILTMQLAWQSPHMSEGDIEAVMKGLRRVRCCPAWHCRHGQLQLPDRLLCFV